MSSEQNVGRAAWLQNIIKTFLNNPSQNTLQNEIHEKAFDQPLVGFSSGDDPVYEDFKKHVGPFHWTPLEIFTKTFPGLPVNPGDLSVISWILPQTEATRRDNRKQTQFPSERWTRARVFGEESNINLRDHVVKALEAEGYEAVAPMLSPLWSRRKSKEFWLSSTWSERHAAYASGLGTFGLCDGLITPVGKAMRTGSVVAHIQLPPTPRPYKDHHQYCLFFTDSICGECMARCPVGAITERGHDKLKCHKHLRISIRGYIKTHFGFKGRGCGLCQTKVPCESKIPTKQDVSEEE
jgi:epoxyqueuosine reductase